MESGVMALEQPSLVVEIREIVRALKVALVEIHPVVEQNGMSVVSEQICKMKKDVDAIGNRVDQARMFCSLDADIDNLASALADRITMADPSAMDNRELLETLLAAELFVMRGRKYLHLRRYELLPMEAGDGVASIAG